MNDAADMGNVHGSCETFDHHGYGESLAEWWGACSTALVSFPVIPGRSRLFRRSPSRWVLFTTLIK